MFCDVVCTNPAADMFGGLTAAEQHAPSREHTPSSLWHSTVMKLKNSCYVHLQLWESTANARVENVASM
jgi:hypothetical protein